MSTQHVKQELGAITGRGSGTTFPWKCSETQVEEEWGWARWAEQLVSEQRKRHAMMCGAGKGGERNEDKRKGATICLLVGIMTSA